MKILAFDIETAPALAYTFSVYNTNIGANQIVEYPRIIAFSAQWQGKKSVIFRSEYHDGRTKMLEDLHALLDESDAVITYNGDRFDIPWVEGEFIAEGMFPPSPVVKIDLLKVIRKHTRWVHKKLDVVSDRLLGERKIEHQGFGLWRDCLIGDDAAKEKAWNLMRRYAKKDTALLWPLYEQLKPWIKLPHPATDVEGFSCRNCGSYNLTRRGFSLTLNGRYQRYQCECGTWQRGTQRMPVGESRPV